MNPQQILKELQTLDPQKPGNWPLYVRVAVVVILMLVIAGVGYYQFVTPLLDELAGVQQEEIGLKETFEAKQRKVASLDALKEQLAEMERSFGTMLRVLPSRAEIANLLIDISQTRLANSLEEELFQPHAALEAGAAGDAQREVGDANGVVGGNRLDDGRLRP